MALRVAVSVPPHQRAKSCDDPPPVIATPITLSSFENFPASFEGAASDTPAAAEATSVPSFAVPPSPSSTVMAAKVTATSLLKLSMAIRVMGALPFTAFVRSRI